MPEKFKPLKARYRATFAAGSVEEPRVGNIDKENEVLHDVQITLEGEARGHGVFLDRAFCEAVVEAGNAAGEAGVKCRFGHPAMCSDALGTYLGRLRNFRCVDVTRKESGEKAAGVIADLYLAKESHSAPAGDLGKWVLEAAENSPDQFGQSIVFTYADLKSTKADGAPILRSEFDSDRAFDEARGENRIYAVLGKLHGSDFTDTPAATDGVFSQDSLAAEADEMLAEHPEIAETILKDPSKVIEFLDRAGLLSILETKRVAGLQASKDKTIAELKDAEKVLTEKLAANEAELTALKAEAGKVAELSAKIETLKSDIDAKSKALDQAAADIQQLEAKNAEVEKSLSETKADLAAETERYRAQVGGAMQPSESKSSKSFRQQLSELPMDEKVRAAFYAAHKAEIDNNK